MATTSSVDALSMFDIIDRMSDDFQPPDRRKWSFEELFKNWVFFFRLCHLGYVTVSYNGSPFLDFAPSRENRNRHQSIALSCFVSTSFSKLNSKVRITCPHELGGDFVAVFERISDNQINYTTESGVVVRFRFDASRQSQFKLL